MSEGLGWAPQPLGLGTGLTRIEGLLSDDWDGQMQSWAVSAEGAWRDGRGLFAAFPAGARAEHANF